jgi:glutathione S-transferase
MSRIRDRLRLLVMTTHRLVLHEHPFASFCQKPLVALYELGVPFERHIVTDEAARRELAELWPLAKIPVLRDETAGLTLPESTSIIEYVDSLAPDGLRLIPADPVAALETRLWDRFHDQYIAAPMQKIVGDSLRPDGRTDPTGVEEARRTLDIAYTILDAQLAEHAWASGPAFTLADCAAAPALFYARVVHRWSEPGQPNITRYYRDLLQRASVARVVEEPRPYRELFPMRWPADVDAF